MVDRPNMLYRVIMILIGISEHKIAKAQAIYTWCPPPSRPTTSFGVAYWSFYKMFAVQIEHSSAALI